MTDNQELPKISVFRSIYDGKGAKETCSIEVHATTEQKVLDLFKKVKNLGYLK